MITCKVKYIVFKSVIVILCIFTSCATFLIFSLHNVPMLSLCSLSGYPAIRMPFAIQRLILGRGASSTTTLCFSLFDRTFPLGCIASTMLCYIRSLFSLYLCEKRNRCSHEHQLSQLLCSSIGIITRKSK